MPMYEDHYDGGDGWVPGVDFDPHDSDEMEIMRLVWAKEKYEARDRLERENRILRETVNRLHSEIAKLEGKDDDYQEVADCDGEDCDTHGPVRKLRWMKLCFDCYNFYRRQDAADAEFDDYVYGTEVN